MRALVVGTGAAGNKAVIDLLEKKVIDEQDMLLVNSTLKDLPEAYKTKAVRLSDETDGCGKERNVSKVITAKALETGRLNFDGVLQDYHDKVIIVASCEGGTGSGNTPVLADHLYNEYGVNVEVVAFKGFEEDARGIANTVEFFQDLAPEYGVQIIDNASFLKEAGKDQKKAQKLANDELARRVLVSLGSMIIDSEDNIDETDLYKTTNTPGYSTIEYRNIEEKIANPDEFNQILSEMVDNSHSLSLEKPSMKRLAVIMNLQESSQKNIDASFSILKEKLGTPYEVFKHIQYEKTLPEFIAFIASGMKLPIEELTAIRDRYEALSSATDKSTENFFDQVRSFSTKQEDSAFDMVQTRRRRKGGNNKSSVLNRFNNPEPKKSVDEILKDNKSEY